MNLRIRSRNHTANGLKGMIEVPIATVLRLGSTTPNEEIFSYQIKTNRPYREINTVEGCNNSSNKILMKQCFINNNVITAEYNILATVANEIDNWPYYPAIIKHKYSSKGEGIYYVEDKNALIELIKQLHVCENYIIEKYYTYSKEYRLHVTNDGCFYSCRKMLRHIAKERWHRHENNSVWILESNPLFDIPSNWGEVVAECIKAKNAVGLDICAVDVKVQTSKYKNPKFIILETNSAPALGEIGVQLYLEQLRKMVNN